MKKHIIKWFLYGSYNHISSMLNNIIYYISLILPLRENLILLESQPDYSDNSLFFYNFLQKNSTKQLEWIVESNVQPCSQTFSYNKKIGLQPITYMKMATAKYVFFSHNYPYFKKKKKKQIIVYMTHGCPIKKNKPKKLKNPPIDYIEPSNFDYALCIGVGAVIPQARFCMCPPSMVLPLGYPRNDFLISNKGVTRDNPFSKNQNEKIIIWMPTFRTSIYKSLSENRSQNNFGLPILNSYEEINYLNSFLKDNEIRLLIKIHRLQQEFPIFSYRFSNIDFITDRILSERNILLYEIIGKTDALLTDYSSIYFDYLLIDKPVGFTLDDYNEYMDDRGFVYEDLKSILAGHHIYSLDDMKSFILDIRSNMDRYSQERHVIKKHFHHDDPMASSKRIAEYFELV